MRSEAVLDLAVFQLTPTRTRCELVIKANGKSETIVSGLLNPFLCHLKTAKDQIEKGGYSITLEPDQKTDAPWFTKGTVERFVRFVSTPEILERVNTLELEIIQTEEAIAVQGNDVPNLNAVEDDVSKSTEYAGGNKLVSDVDASGKAIILYKSGHPSPDSNGEKATPREENAKVNLLRVLQTRKDALRKEQGMAFARAMAAGFTVDNIADLISFAACFGAARLLEACSKFMELYHGKHETGQWLEIDATDAISVRSDITGNTLGPSAIQWATVPVNDPIVEGSNGKINGRDVNQDLPKDVRMNGDSKVAGGSQEYFHGQFPHPTYAHWPIHSPSGMPMFQPYPMQGMPFYPNYPPGAPYMATLHVPSEDPSPQKRKKSKSKKHSSGAKSTVADDLESRGASTQSQDDEGEDIASDDDISTSSQVEKEGSLKESRRKGGRSGGKKSGMVVIKNLNYIASKNRGNHTASGGDESSAPSEVSENEARKDPSRHSKSKGSRRTRTWGKVAERTGEDSQSKMEEAVDFGRELADSGNWQVFQSFLLRDDDEDRKGSHVADRDLFSGEKKPGTMRKTQGSQGGEDLMLSLDRDSGPSVMAKMEDELVGSYATSRRMSKNRDFNGDSFPYSGGGLSSDVNLEVPFEETEGGGSRRVFRKGMSEEIAMIYDKPLPHAKHYSDPIAENEFALPTPLLKGSSDAPVASRVVVSDESFIVPVRLGSPERNETQSRIAVILDSEFPPVTSELSPSSEVVRSQVNYEPDDLSMLPERDTDGDFSLGGGYDPALDYEMDSQAGTVAVVEDDKQEDTTARTEEAKANGEKSLQAAAPAGPGKKKPEPSAARGRLSRFNPSAQAQARADKLRAYKADLQKAKKEKEEEAIRRVEALKLERQRRISARSSGVSQSAPTTQQRKNIPAQTTKASKFSDSPASPSVLHGSKVPVRASPPAGTDARRQVSGSGVTRSVSSLSDAKKGTHAASAAVSRSLSSLSDSRKNISTTTTTQRNKLAPVPQSSTGKRTTESSSRESLQPKLADNGIVASPKEATFSDSKVASMNGSGHSTSQNSVRPDGAAGNVPASKNESNTIQDMDGDGLETTKRAQPETQMGVLNQMIERPSKEDESAVVEKIVVMLEREAPPQQIQDLLLPKEADEEPIAETVNSFIPGAAIPGKKIASSGHAAVHAPPSISIKSQVAIAEDVAKFQEVSAKENETVSEKPLEHLAVENFLIKDGSQSESTTPRAPTPAEEDSCYSIEQEQEAVGKPRSKESLKGLKKLLKFGRKSHGTSAAASELDTQSLDDQPHGTFGGSSSHEGELLAEGTPTKGDKSASRHFSILSPFRSSSKSGVDKKSSPA